MTQYPETLPDITRTDAGTVLVSPWIVKSRQRQHAAVDATISQWQQAPKPEAFLTLNCFISVDGEAVVNYAQWTNDAAHREFVAQHRPRLVSNIDSSVTDIVRPGLVRYRVDSSQRLGAGSAKAVTFTVFSVANTAAQRALAEDLHDLTDSYDSLVASHVHRDVNASRVLLYREWADFDVVNGAVADGITLPVGSEILEDRAYLLYRQLTHRAAPAGLSK